MRYLALVSILLAPVFGSGCKQVPVAGFCDVEGDSRCGDGEVCDVQARACILDPVNTPCTGDGECPAQGPVCTPEGICGRCEAGDDLPCMENHEGRPRCEPVSGACVQCLERSDCSGGTPACDTLNNECVECADHGDCASGACDIAAQECIDPARIINVALPPVGDNANCPTDEQIPCADVNSALALVTDSRDVIVMSAQTHLDEVTVSDLSVTIIGVGATLNTNSNPDVPAFRVQGQSDVTIDSLTIRGAFGNGADGVQCAGSGIENTRVVLTRATVTANNVAGVGANLCHMSISRSIISNNLAGGIVLNNSSFNIDNSLVFGNGSDSSPAGGIRLVSTTGEQVLRFTTVANNDVTSGRASGLACDGAIDAVGNIVYVGMIGAPPTTDAVCGLSFSNIEDLPAENGNIQDPPGFVDADTNDYRLTEESALRDVPGFTVDVISAQDAGLDFDGERRPFNDLYDMGADELQLPAQ